MEAFFFGSLLILALLVLIWQAKPGRLAGLALAAFLALILVATTAGWSIATRRRVASMGELLRNVPGERQVPGFASSQSCRACHPQHYATWHGTYHRTMTQLATPEAVVGDFDNVELTWNGWPCHLFRDDDEFWAELPDPSWVQANSVRVGDPDWIADPPRSRQRIVMTTGSHHMQAYWIPTPAGNVVVSFPFTYLIPEQRWVPNLATFLRPDQAPHFDVWNRKCFKCHAVAVQPRLDLRTLGMDTKVAELGIACEACHGPADRHVAVNRDPKRRYLHHLTGRPDPTIVHPERLSSRRTSQICGQCHAVSGPRDPQTVLEKGFPYRAGDDLDEARFVIRHPARAHQPWLKDLFNGNSSFLEQRFWADGMIRISGREYNGLIESPCFQRGELSCLSCHSMHASAAVDQLAAGMDGDEACLQCHSSFRNDLQAHTHHSPQSSGSRCYNCHMPHTTYGLLKAIRSHEIDSPSVAVDLRSGRPNACNLCHLDRTLAWTQDYLHEWYGAPKQSLSGEHDTTAAALLWLLRGDAGQRALAAWHMAWEPAWEASGRDWLPPFLAPLLNDPYSAVRMVAFRALRRFPGFGDFNYDFVGDAENRAGAPVRVRQLWSRIRPSELERSGPHVLINDADQLDDEAIRRLLEQRDDRTVDLRE